MAETRASTAIARYLARRQLVGRTRFQPEADVKKERDPNLPGVVFYRYPDGSSIRLDHAKGNQPGDIQEF